MIPFRLRQCSKIAVFAIATAHVQIATLGAFSSKDIHTDAAVNVSGQLVLPSRFVDYLRIAVVGMRGVEIPQFFIDLVSRFLE